MPFTPRYTITPQYLTMPSKRRPGTPMSPGVRFIVAHDTGNPGSTARQNVRYFESTPKPERTASAHLFVDDREIIECIPALTGSGSPEKAYHVLYSVPRDDQLFGFDANDAAIGVEYCYGGRIDADEAYRKYVWVIAYACATFALDPRTSAVGHFVLDPQRKTDPVTGLAQSHRLYEQLLRDVVAEYEACSGEALSPVHPSAGGDFPREVTARVRLNIRRGRPSTLAAIHQTVPPGTALTAASAEPQGQPVNNNPVWYRDPNGNYFWSGGVA